jgi:hypothetical protein
MKQALVCNKNVVLITDATFSQPGVEVINESDYLKSVEEFRTSYIHMSTNSHGFEMICIERWFILRNYMEHAGIQVAYYSDSDVMIYDDLSTIYSGYKNYECAYTMPLHQDNLRWSASACCSFWTLSSIKKFCDFILSSYQPENIGKLREKWDYHQRNSQPGGVCDMTLLYLFAQTVSHFSLSKENDGLAFDQNMLDSENYLRDEYRMEKRFGEDRMQKKILWRDGRPYGFNMHSRKEVRFIVLTEYAKLLEQKVSVLDAAKRSIRKLIGR